MLTQYIPNPKVPGVCIHNTGHWQVTELMGGLACELLYKKRDVSGVEAARLKLSLHECFPSLFMQGDEATEFLQELRAAQAKLDARLVDALMLSAYSDVVH